MEEIELDFESEDAGVRRQSNLPSATSRQNHQHSAEYGEEVSAKMKVAVLYAMLRKDLQERVLDKCAVNWDGVKEAEAATIFCKV